MSDRSITESARGTVRYGTDPKVVQNRKDCAIRSMSREE